jgi:hypothetical protein
MIFAVPTRNITHYINHSFHRRDSLLTLTVFVNNLFSENEKIDISHLGREGLCLQRQGDSSVKTSISPSACVLESFRSRAAQRIHLKHGYFQEHILLCTPIVHFFLLSSV